MNERPHVDDDPHNDDFDLDRDAAEDNPNNVAFYSQVNGFEENSHLDSEDVNRDNAYQRRNDFKRYVIPLNDTTYVATEVAVEFAGEVPVNEENGVNGWRLFRIPIEDGIEVGSINPGNVRHLRIWFTGFRGPQLLQIAGIDILGSLFKDDLLRDSTGVAVAPGLNEVVKIRGINNKEDPEYVAPFELEEQNRVIEREQSLAIDFESLGPGHEGAAFKALPADKDYTLYETLKWYVHGDENQGPGVEAFLRFGSADSVNYYEYAVPLRPGWSEETIPVTELSSLKLSVTNTDTCRVSGKLVACYEQELTEGRRIRLVGQPSLTRVRRIVFGVRNVSSLPQTGSIWFDDLRLDDVIRDMGTALRFDMDAGFADFMTLSTRLLTRDEDFLSIGSSGGRSLARGFGSRQRDLNVQSTVNLHKFFETSGIKLPVAFNMTHNREFPEFSSGDDVVLSPEQSTQSGARHAGADLLRQLQPPGDAKRRPQVHPGCLPGPFQPVRRPKPEPDAARFIPRDTRRAELRDQSDLPADQAREQRDPLLPGQPDTLGTGQLGSIHQLRPQYPHGSCPPITARRRA